MEPCTFQPKFGKVKKLHQDKSFLYLKKQNPPKKTSYIFSKESFIFQETETLKKFFIFKKMETLKTFLYFRN